MALKHLYFVSFFLSLVLYSLAQETIEHKILQKILKIDNISKKIQEATNVSLRDSFLEAFPKKLSGFAEGNFYHFGDFEHCHNVRKGKYCLGYYVMDKDFIEKTFQLNSMQIPGQFIYGARYKQENEAARLYYGICTPEDFALDSLSSNFTFLDAICYHQNDAKLPRSTLIIIFFTIIYMSCVVCVTFWDFWYGLSASYLKLFSVLRSIKQVFLAPKSEISCLDGIRALTLIATVAGHALAIFMIGPSTEYFTLLELQEYLFKPIIAKLVIVMEVLWLISGCLTALNFFKRDKFSLYASIKHRYLRLAPHILLLTMFYIFCLEHLDNGPVWKAIKHVAVQPCREHWWKSFFFIANINPKDGYFCAMHTWSVSVDMQLFVLSPVVLLALRRSTNLGLLLSGSLILTGAVLSIYKLYTTDLGFFLDWEQYFVEFYTQTQYRFPAYVIGLVTGCVLHKSKSRTEVVFSPGTQNLLWYLTIFVALCSFWVGFDGTSLELGRFAKPFVLVLNRQLFCIAFSGFILMCYKFGGRTAAFLSNYVFRLVTKFSYSIASIHFFLMLARYSAVKTPYPLDGFFYLRNLFLDSFWTLVFSVLLHLFVETRIDEIIRYFTKKMSKTH